VRKFAQEQNRTSLNLSEESVRSIENHPWPGNIRELENCIKRAVIMADGKQILPDDIGLDVVDTVLDTGSLDLRSVRDTAERNAIIAALGRVNGNVLKAAELLGVSRPTLYDLMHRLGLK
jgi:two-component system NtrC family response regulator